MPKNIRHPAEEFAPERRARKGLRLTVAALLVLGVAACVSGMPPGHGDVPVTWEQAGAIAGMVLCLIGATLLLIAGK